MEENLSFDALSTLYDELTYEDAEHPDVALTFDEWCLSAFGSGLLIWGNLETIENEDRHMKNVPKEKTIELWIKLAQGKVSEVDAEPWLPGYR